MKVLDFGSLNVDNVYTVRHMVQGGETIASSDLNVFCGGKGLNQAVALAKAGANVYMAGAIGTDGDILLDMCKEYGVKTDYIEKMDAKGGHTVIQVDENGQNSIILYGGTNRMITKERVDEVLSDFEAGDFLLLQNEINNMAYIIDRAFERGMKIILNPSPYDDNLSSCDLKKISLFMLNEVEGKQITGQEDPERILTLLNEMFPEAEIVLTLGKDGAIYYNGREKYQQDAFKVKAVDTTAAGDTFTGYYLALTAEGASVPEALKTASRASSIAVTRPGAAPSIPMREEL